MTLKSSDGSVPAPDFRSLFESAPGLYLVLTPDLRIVAVSNAYLAATMTTRHEILGRGLFDVFPDNPDDPSATGVRNLAASLERVKRFGHADAMPLQKYDVRRPDSEGGEFDERYWSPLNTPVFDAAGEVEYIIHRVEDITEFVRLKQAGSEREKMTQQLRTRAEQMETEVFLRAQQVSEANLQLRNANHELARLYDQILHLMIQADTELRPFASSEPAPRALNDAGDPEDMLARVGRLIAGYKSLNDQLRQAQKMEAIGRLAGGVAHDFNNLLTVIVGYAKFVQDKVAAGNELHGMLAEIQRAGEHAAELTQQLLAFSRKQLTQHHLLQLNDVIVELKEILRRLVSEDIVLTFKLDPGGCRLQADKAQLTQILMNLVANARDAMSAGGVLVIETRSAMLESGYSDQHGVRPPGPYVVLRVADSGKGMDADTQARVFEPFFTTKEIGKGTGLGLATVHGIVLQHRGWIQIVSASGRGTTVEVYLPAATAEPAPQPVAESPALLSASPATILLVEDQAAIRLFAEDILTDAGHTVLSAPNGTAALRVAAAHAGIIDLLITDVVMPEMNGPILAAQLTQHRPGLIVLYMSGYTDSALLDRGVIPEHVTLLQKPFLPDDLVGKVSQLLESRQLPQSESNRPETAGSSCRRDG
jgi:signal transduction histidine kinase/FixJ family two-component response regulator